MQRSKLEGFLAFWAMQPLSQLLHAAATAQEQSQTVHRWVRVPEGQPEQSVGRIYATSHSSFTSGVEELCGFDFEIWAKVVYQSLLMACATSLLLRFMSTITMEEEVP